MSRIGKLPVKLDEKVTAEVVKDSVVIKGPKGELAKKLPWEIDVEIKDNQIFVKAKNDTKRAKSMHGTYRMLIANMIKGVTEGWTKELELVGTGYRASTSGKNLELTVGFSHPVVIEAPEGIDFKVEKNKITIEGYDKELVGQIAAKIRDVRPPEPYKGKGILYAGEVVRRKPGKAAKAQGAAA